MSTFFVFSLRWAPARRCAGPAGGGQRYSVGAPTFFVAERRGLWPHPLCFFVPEFFFFAGSSWSAGEKSGPALWRARGEPRFAPGRGAGARAAARARCGVRCVGGLFCEREEDLPVVGGGGGARGRPVWVVYGGAGVSEYTQAPGGGIK